MRRSYCNLVVVLSCLLGLLCSSVRAIPTADSTIQCHGPTCDPQPPIASDISTAILPADLAKRTNPGVPPAAPSTPPGTNNYQELFAELEQAGWEHRFTPGAMFSPVYTSSRNLVEYFNRCMAIVAANMLADAPLPHPAVFGQLGPLSLTILVRERCVATRCITNGLTWQLLYYLLLFLRNYAARGFSGTGTLQLANRRDPQTQTAIRVSLKLREGLGQVVYGPCGSPGSGRSC